MVATQQMLLGGAAARTVIALAISASSNTPYNIFSNKGGTYVAGTSDITLTVNGGVTQGSNTTASPAIDTGTGWTAGDTVTIVVSGTVQGMGGQGGSGGLFTGGIAPTAGSNGGGAIKMQYAMTLQGAGIIGGGGGGGGGGGRDTSSPANGGAGGGGMGGAGGAIGAAGQTATATAGSSSSGGNGSVGAGGAGGTPGTGGAGHTAGVTGGNGGSATGSTGQEGGGGAGGGGLGAAGGLGGMSLQLGQAGSAGGNPGWAVSKNGNTLTNSFAGTTYGSIV